MQFTFRTKQFVTYHYHYISVHYLVSYHYIERKEGRKENESGICMYFFGVPSSKFQAVS